MKTTIDKAGRVVIPASLRERAGLTAGSELEVTADDLGIRLERVAAGPRLVKVGKRTVARPTVIADAPGVRVREGQVVTVTVNLRPVATPVPSPAPRRGAARG